MKRIICLVLAAVLVLGLLGTVSVSVFAAETFTTSDACVVILKQHEGFCKYPIWDYAQYTVGYGTRCPDDMLDYYKKNGITEEEAETLLRNFLNAFEKEVNERLIQKYNLNLNQNQFDALVSFSYNCGTAWMRDTDSQLMKAILGGATGNDLIRVMALWCNAGGEVLTYLLQRRLSEANMYLNGVYERKPPENYCYVLYNANGGTTSPKTQGYDCNLEVAPYPVPTYSGYTFEGWYTERVGGEKVTRLTADHHATTLYAHWVDGNGNSSFSQQGDVTVTVTGTDVNVRKGPGTNYAKVGTVTKGDQLLITETATAGGYTWGKFDKGWMALQYTNYETVILEKPDTQQPEATTPTEPEITEPETTAPTEPEVTEPENTSVYGIVKVQDRLRIRSGAGTGYSIAGYLKPNERVEILEQKTVGSVTWARISQGWVSMQYVVLESDNSGSSGSSGSGSTTDSGSSSSAVIGSGTVYNCTRLRIRSGAGTNYGLVGYLSNGTRVSFTEYKQVGSMTWGKISNGWISLTYVRLDSDSSTGTNTDSGSSSASAVSGTVKVQDLLRIRSGPGTSYAIAGYLKPNERVEITEQKTVGSMTWGKISKGWISMQYVVLDGAQSSSGSSDNSASTGDVRTVVATCLHVRSAAGTGNTIVGYLYTGTQVTILETATVAGRSWGRIANGWICLEYVK